MKATAQNRGRALKRIGGGAALGVLLSGGGVWAWYFHRPQPPDLQRELFPGVTYYREARRTPRPMVIHIVKVALDRSNISLLVTPGDTTQPRPLRGKVTSDFLRERRLQVAINGDFFFPWHSRTLWDYYPHVGDPVELQGVAASQGVVYSFGGERWKFPTLYFTKNNRGVFNRVPDGLWNAISGSGMLIEHGVRKTTTRLENEHTSPRTALALDRDSRTLILLVVDGRQPNYSEGATANDLSEIFLKYGAYNAMNLDGGGSTTLVIEGKNGQPEVLNCPIDQRIPGRERPVANHLGVFVAK